MQTKTKLLGAFLLSLSLSLVFLLSAGSALAKKNSKPRIFHGTVFSIDQENNHLVILRDKTSQNFTVSYSPSLLYRSSGGRAQEIELNVGDKLKVKGVLQTDSTITAKKITDQSIKRKFLIGFMDSVNDENDTLDLQVKNRLYLVNIEEFTDLLYRYDTLGNGRTRTKVKGIVNTNTKKLYKTEYIIMWSK